MAKYKITEEQLQKIFERMEMNRLSEMDNYNYPAGSDTPSAPWNQESPKTSEPMRTSGNYVMVEYISGEYLIRNSNNNQLLYTLDEVWEQQEGRSWSDIKDRLKDYLEVPEESAEDEEGRYTTSRSDWKDYIEMDDLAEALVSYLNSSKGDSGIVGVEEFKDGSGEFLIVDSESVDEIVNESLRNKALSILEIPKY
jgi:hypothetical protein